jgi:alpha-tubulin suppressor-like RCC1 family protein
VVCGLTYRTCLLTAKRLRIRPRGAHEIAADEEAYPYLYQRAFIAPLPPHCVALIIPRFLDLYLSFAPCTCIAGPGAGGASGYTAHCWGTDELLLAPQKGVVAVSVGHRHMLFLMADGSVKAFNYNSHGQTYVPESRIRNQAVKVAAGTNHSLVLLRDGTVVGFGSNLYGETDPMPSEALPGGQGVADIAAGPNYSLFLLKNGSVTGIGDTTYAPLLNLSPAILHNVSSISCGWQLCGAVKVSGELVLWGHNSSLLNENTTISPIPPEVEAAGVATLSVGYSHVAAMLRNGQGAVWGLNDDDQAKFPDGIAPNDVTFIVVGAWHTVVLLSDGQLKAFGNNNAYQTNIFVNDSSETIVGVAAGSLSSCALLLSPPEAPLPRTCSCCFSIACILQLSSCLCAHVRKHNNGIVPMTLLLPVQRQRRRCRLLHLQLRCQVCVPTEFVNVWAGRNC